MAPTLWIHRVSVDDSGSPESPVALDDIVGGLGEVARAVMRGPRETLAPEPEQARAFLRSELLERGVLRQGWGAPGMRANRESDFLKNFVIAMWRYWGAIPTSVRDQLRSDPSGSYSSLFTVLEPFYRQASGRLAILTRMVEMRHGDVIFVPNMPTAGETFTVCTIDDREYRFEDRATPSATAVWQIDYGHVRAVRTVRSYTYGADTLERGVFGAPYLHAIDRVSARESALRQFLSAHYA